MKKLLTIAALVGAASMSFGQGVVNFTSASQLLTTNSAVGGPTTGRISGGAYFFALLDAPTSQTTVDALFTGWTFTGNYGTNTLAGRFSGNYTTDPGVTVSGYAPGALANFVIVGWSAAIGHDWTTVLPWWQHVQATGAASSEGWFGYSGVASSIIVGGGAIPVPNLMGVAPLPGTFNLNMQPVPEPATLALAGLGAAAMLIFRRRK